MLQQRTTAVIAALVLTGGLAGVPAVAQHGPGEGAGRGHHHPRFDDPGRWSRSFDDPARDAWQKPDEVIRTLAPGAGALVADIGAGTGYFTVRLARALPMGRVFAVDVEPKMVEHIVTRARENGLTNVRGVIAGAAAPNLPEPVDLVLMVNVYHHVDGRTDYMRGLANSLRHGGRVAIIEARPEAREGPPKHFRLAAATIDAEMTAAGYRLVSRHDFLERQNFLVYERIGR